MPKQIYFIAIIPPASVAEEITTLRKRILPGINLQSEHKKFPHITLQHTFRRLPEIENELELHFSELASTINSFTISAENFGHFDSRIIYISIINNKPLQGLYEKVQELLLEQMNFTQEEISKSFHPHVTLEKKLTPELFSKGWESIRKESFSLTFNVSHFSLLKHNGIKWESISNFQLK